MNLLSSLRRLVFKSGPHPDFNLLRRVDSSAVCAEPYPHIVIENALPDALYEALASTYPAESLIRSAKQVANRDQLQAPDVLKGSGIAPIWKEWVRYHVSSEFYSEILRVFGPHIRRHYPWLEGEKGRPMEQWSVGLRDATTRSLPDVCLDCQPGLNHITTVPATPRTAHLDAPNKLVTGLLYMRLDDDMASGGDFVLYRGRVDPLPFDTPTTVPESALEPVRIVPYRKNTVVFFLNTPVALHGVTIRGATPIPRRLVNLVAGLYTLKNRTLYPVPEPSITPSVSGS